MADLADKANEIMIKDNRTPYKPPECKKGDCETCGEWSTRLVNGMCVPCREKYKV